MRTLKFTFFTLLLSTMSFSSFAHALWIETNSTGKTGIKQDVKVYYGEFASNERENIDKWFSDVSDFSLWLTKPDLTKVKLSTNKATNLVQASFIPETDGQYIISVVHEPKDLGGTTKYEFSSVALVNVGKPKSTNLNTLDNSLFAFSNSQVKKGSNLEIKVHHNKEIAKDKKVIISSPEGWSKEFISNENGVVNFSPIWPGKYVVEVTDFEKKTGEHNGKSYTAAWKGATSSFDVIK